MREIKGHEMPDSQQNSRQSTIEIEACERNMSEGNLSSTYVLWILSQDGYRLMSPRRIDFQAGDPKDVGRNGITEEAVLAILIDRLRCKQESGASRQNEKALTHLEEALHWLLAR